MNKPKFFTPKFIECAIRYLVYFLAVAITPFFAKPFAPLFDWTGYGLMRPLFVEIFTIIFWVVEWVVIFAVEHKLKRKASATQETEVSSEKEEEKKSVKVDIPFSLRVRPPLPLKNVVILTIMCVVCIFTLSAVIGFQVKPVYDLGEKIEGYDMYNKFGWLGKRVFQCFWILGMVKACKGMAGEIISNSSLAENKQWVRWIIQAAMLLVFALFEVFVATMLYPMGLYSPEYVSTITVAYPFTLTKLLIALTYLLFYVLFIPVQELTEGSDVKAFLLIVLIYLF